MVGRVAAAASAARAANEGAAGASGWTIRGVEVRSPGAMRRGGSATTNQLAARRSKIVRVAHAVPPSRDTVIGEIGRPEDGARRGNCIGTRDSGVGDLRDRLVRRGPHAESRVPALLRYRHPILGADRLCRRRGENGLTLRARMHAVEADVRPERSAREEHIDQIEVDLG